MRDAGITWKDGRGELVIAGGDLLNDDSINTAVIISYFTDRRAEPGDTIPDGTTDARGYWGDAYRADPIGSRLWLLAREKSLPDVLNRAAIYARESVQWLIKDGWVKSIRVTTFSPEKKILAIQTDIVLPDGTALPPFIFTAEILGV